MERKNNALYFEPWEKDKFLRAIPLIMRINGYTADNGLDTVKHERAHIEETERLGHTDKIKGYTIKVERKIRLGIGKLSVSFGKDRILYSVAYNGGIPRDDDVRIFMAPEMPSEFDFYNVMVLLGFHEEYERLKRSGHGAEEHRRDILERLSSPR